MNRPCFLALVPLCLLLSCQQVDTRESYARSLLGEPLPMPKLDDAARTRLTARLDEARARWESDPENEDAIIWYGRRLAYLSRYEEAIAVYRDGLAKHPESFRLLRHRGHRYISIRRFGDAIADLERAAELAAGTPLRIEADGIPNARNTPISTTQGNIWYHLGLARYLAGDLEGALSAYDLRRDETDRNDDNLVSTAYWRHIILMRLGREDEAEEAVSKVRRDLDVIENGTYRDLALLFQGTVRFADLAPEADAVHSRDVADATLAYGLSMYHLTRGDRAAAARRWRAIVDGSRATAAFGYIAAEAELARGPDR